MTKEEIYQRVLDCRLIADEIYTETRLLPNADERFKFSWYMKEIIYEIDVFLRCLRKMGADSE